MPAFCPVQPVTKWWAYALAVVVFALAVGIFWALINAEKKVFLESVSLYDLGPNC